jgi:hypothetical protein
MAINGEKALMISVMRNEGPYILEWLAHHFALGVDDLLIFTNQCTDNTDRILDRLEVLMPHRVKHQPNPKIMFPRQGLWHIMALRFAGHFGRYRAADWLSITDADEFLNLKRGIPDLDGFFDAAGPADAVSFTSVAFNSNGQRAASTRPVTRRFTQTTVDFKAAADQNQRALTAVKSLFRNSVQGHRRPHRPVTKNFTESGAVWINGSGKPMTAEWIDSGNKAIEGHGTRTLAQVNHYSIKSAAEFLLKVDRGDAVNAERLGASEQYWAHANRVGVTDRTGVGLSPAAQELFDFFLSDPELRELHEQSFAIRERQLETILKTEAGEKLAQAIGYFD